MAFLLESLENEIPEKVSTSMKKAAEKNPALVFFMRDIKGMHRFLSYADSSFNDAAVYIETKGHKKLALVCKEDWVDPVEQLYDEINKATKVTLSSKN